MIALDSADRLFVLTGAGCSAESGIPTFRGAAGLWQNHRIEEVASPVAWARDPRLVWDFYSWRRETALPCAPNAAHLALARLGRGLGERMFLCTQNVDDLHEQAGSADVVHMHGSLFETRCDRCSRPPFRDTASYRDELPRCDCGGGLRVNVVWFGEMPFHLDRIWAELERGTVFLAVGTSGVVEPAASFVRVIRARPGTRAYYVGPEEPYNSAAFDRCFLGKAGELLPGLFAMQGPIPSVPKTKQEQG